MGIIHGDIKPENVLVDQWENIRIAEFSAARRYKVALARSDLDVNLSVGDIGACTREYCAPEYQNKGQFGPMMDYWALGCTVWDMLAGEVSSRFHLLFLHPFVPN